MVQLLVEPDMHVLLEIVKSPGFVPVMETADTLKLPFGLLIVTVSGELVLPTATAPKLKLDGETVMLVTHAFRLTTSGARKPPLDGLIVNAPLIGPELSPPVLNVRSVLQLAPEPRLLPQVLLPRLKPPLGVKVSPSVAASWLVNVTVCTGVVVLDRTCPKSSADGEEVTGATPVPESPTTCGLVLSLSATVIAPG